ncbi:OVARIAN TUMOR DOMAIN-containing deubiquitinating enzyme 7 isoform X3 [Raphanus sativus]|uniref:OVARIAN TUMOR DOMAIN-containing deubiquitinating enzyme 7 isoform X3 n=2 Tax=Raphanus sativus TaxID=3726 RepID=A0A6J0LC48_RAPSA|nr:OVARIAN TUMOR DOMAIN-containing deubiquitinating enzyme 7 isoform X3 [Raphanus sativus]
MAKAKQQKSSKPKKQPRQVEKKKKKEGKDCDLSQFRAQLDSLGLKIIQVTADGNCFFRSLADQLEGNEDEHSKYRSMVVQYIVNREMFEPFIEDDVPFEDYCKTMDDDGTWAGNMELQAASLVTRSNICIHRSMSPRWYIRNFEDARTRMIHLSYHDGEHYNSVRSKEDACGGPARPVVIEADAKVSAASKQAKATEGKSKNRSDKCDVDAGAVKVVMLGSCCNNAEKAEQVLVQVNGDVDAAIEFLIAEQGMESMIENDSETASAAMESTEQLREAIETISEDESGSCSSIETVLAKCSLDDKKIPRNKSCPCGSKKKYKSCCGTAAGRSSVKLLVSQTMESKKGRKNLRRGTSNEVEANAPDVGALCI